MTAVDQEPIATAIKAALTAALPTGVVAYDIDDVPGANDNAGILPNRYVTVFVSRRYTSEQRFGGSVMLPGGRVVLRYCAENVANVREFRRRSQGALEDVILPLAGGGDVGPFVFEVEDAIRPDDVALSGVDTFTF